MLLGLLLLLLLLLLLFLLLLLLQQPLLLLLVLRLNLRADGCDCHVRLKEANKHRQTESKLRAGSVDVVVGGGDGGGRTDRDLLDLLGHSLDSILLLRHDFLCFG